MTKGVADLDRLKHAYVWICRRGQSVQAVLLRNEESQGVLEYVGRHLADQPRLIGELAQVRDVRRCSHTCPNTSGKPSLQLLCSWEKWPAVDVAV